MTATSDEVKQALETIFTADSEIYQRRGFQRRIGYGTRPALLVIDMAKAWTQPGYAFTCDDMDTIIPANQALLAAAREKRIPIVFTTTAYQDPKGPHADTGLWHLKIPAETLEEGSDAAAIDERLAPGAGEQIIVKKRASAFHGTMLAGYLRAHRVDTAIITGVTMSACVRNSTEDAIAEGFRPIVVREAVGDRAPGTVEWNLFDINAKFGDVEPLEDVLRYLESVEALRNE
ncbi:MAG: isochorismatase family protein [Gammaproteobacteria bacterium]